MSNHLKDINMKYFEHMFCAAGFALKLFKAAAILFIHSLFPNVFVTTGSEIVNEVHKKMNEHQGK